MSQKYIDRIIEIHARSIQIEERVSELNNWKVKYKKRYNVQMIKIISLFDIINFSTKYFS